GGGWVVTGGGMVGGGARGGVGRAEERSAALVSALGGAPRRASRRSRSTPSRSEKRFFLAMGENGPYSETSFYLEAKFFRNVDERNSDVNETSQERCGR